MSLTNLPSKQVLYAFGVKSPIELLVGGQGNTYRADNIVLKEVENIEQANWTAELFSNLQENDFRVENPIRSISNQWVSNGWCAFGYLEGKETKERWKEKIEVSRKFHDSISHISKPHFIDKTTHPWGIADKMVWGKIPLIYSPRLENVIQPLKQELKPINLPEQLIHGDMTGNILFSDFYSPAIIDMSPYWHISEYATAIIIVDSIVWDNAPDSLLDMMPNDFDSNQLLLRAAMWRIKTTEEFIKKYNKGNINNVDSYKHLIDLIITRMD
jgi:uncharacterized protein (TIGR02569 family)